MSTCSKCAQQTPQVVEGQAEIVACAAQQGVVRGDKEDVRPRDCLSPGIDNSAGR